MWDAARAIRGAKGSATLTGRKKEGKLGRIADHGELKQNDHNISPATTSTPATPKPFCQ